MSELKRCPFCGGEAKMSEVTWFPLNVWSVYCENHCCTMPMRDSRNKAIEEWNKRAGDANELFSE